MGLDITAVSKLQHAPTYQPPEDDYEDGYHFAFWYDGFDASGRGLVRDAWYAATPGSEYHGFRAGSYGGYGEWRNDLAASAGLSLDDYWNEPDRGQLFYELINFADNEGTIGPDAAKNLLADFKAHRAVYVASRAAGNWGQYDIERYDDWTRAVELASDAGMVIFH